MIQSDLTNFRSSLRVKSSGPAPMAMLPPAWVDKFFTGDRIAREAFTFLSPRHHHSELTTLDGTYFGPKIRELGTQLFEEGSLPGLESWEFEESPEFKLSIDLWDQALEEESSKSFDSLMQACYLQAEAAYGLMGRLASRLAALRWCCCMCWLAARSTAVEAASAGGSFGTVDKPTSLAACKEAKHIILGWLRDLVRDASTLAIFDFDLVGHGVWHNKGREPLLKEAHDEWFRRGVEYDIVRLCMQALHLPPAELNASAPIFKMVQPLGSLDLYIPPPVVPRRIIDRHGWFAVVLPPPLDCMPAKAPVPGPVLHADIPPEPEFDFDDPEIIAKVERGEDLGKGHQADGLPGAVHGSVGLLFAAMCFEEKLEHIHFTTRLLELDGFVDCLLRYGPPLRSLDLSGCNGAVDEACLKLLALAGSSVQILDLGDCGLHGACLDPLLEVLAKLTGVQHLDLAENEFDQTDTVHLVAELARRRIDVGTVRLDKNPIGEPSIIKESTALLLAQRGRSTVGGGELVLHLGDNAVRWYPAAEPDQPLARLRDGNGTPLQMTSLKELRQATTTQKRRLEEFEATDPHAQTEDGQKWLQHQRKMAEAVLESDMMQIYRRELAARAKPSQMDAAGGP